MSSSETNIQITNEEEDISMSDDVSVPFTYFIFQIREMKLVGYIISTCLDLHIGAGIWR